MVKNVAQKLLQFYEGELWNGAFKLGVPPQETPNNLCTPERGHSYPANCLEDLGNAWYRPLYRTVKAYQTLSNSCLKGVLIIIGIVLTPFTLIGLIFKSVGGHCNKRRVWKNEAYKHLQSIYGIYESRLKRRVDFLTQEYAALLANPSIKLEACSDPQIKESDERLFRLYGEYNLCIAKMEE